jgi:type IV pilus assembly protein PilB
VAKEADLRQKIEIAYLKHQVYEERTRKPSDESIDGKKGASSLNLVLNSNDQASEVENLTNKILEKAIHERASDIHIERQEHELIVRERIDGRLKIGLVLPHRYHASLVSRLKIMGGLDIAEKRVPQDGRFATQLSGQKVDFRISTLPTTRGEKVVIRILNKGNMKLGLENLGMNQRMVEQVRGLLHHPHGLILVCGPTGSGKTTTVYSMLDEIKSTELNILTIEDPVEYNFELVNQVQVNTKAGLTFASILRNFLRQDPDVIMVGEIRDAETAEIAVRAALTGHLVISTIHTNDALSAVTRLTDMGIDPFLISDSLLGVVAQRLVRKLCKSCVTESDQLNDQDPEFAQRVFKEIGKIFRAPGCPECQQSGYLGREGIYEVLKIDRKIRAAISVKCSAETLRQIVEKNEFHYMTEHGLEKVKAGLTSVEEILRSTLDLSS